MEALARLQCGRCPNLLHVRSASCRLAEPGLGAEGIREHKGACRGLWMVSVGEGWEGKKLRGTARVRGVAYHVAIQPLGTWWLSGVTSRAAEAGRSGPCRHWPDPLVPEVRGSLVCKG